MITGNFNIETPFADWFNTNLKGKPLFPHGVNVPNFESIMDRIKVIFSPDLDLNLYEFAAVFCNIYNETGGLFVSMRERGELAYFFETRDMGGWTKQSYNRPVNGTRPAGDYMKSLGIISAPGDVAAWNGTVKLPTTPPAAVANAKRCDFYRFRGFGLNQITWRSIYQACLQPHLPKSMDAYTVEEFEALTKDIDLACKAMNSYLRQPSMKDAMRDIEHGEFYEYGKRIGGGYYSTHVFVPRCIALVDAMKPYFLPKTQGVSKETIIQWQKALIAADPDAALIISKSGGADGIWGKASQQAFLHVGWTVEQLMASS